VFIAPFIHLLLVAFLSWIFCWYLWQGRLCLRFTTEKRSFNIAHKDATQEARLPRLLSPVVRYGSLEDFIPIFAFSRKVQKCLCFASYTHSWLVDSTRPQFVHWGDSYYHYVEDSPSTVKMGTFLFVLRLSGFATKVQNSGFQSASYQSNSEVFPDILSRCIRYFHLIRPLLLFVMRGSEDQSLASHGNILWTPVQICEGQCIVIRSSLEVILNPQPPSKERWYYELTLCLLRGPDLGKKRTYYAGMDASRWISLSDSEAGVVFSFSTMTQALQRL